MVRDGESVMNLIKHNGEIKTHTLFLFLVRVGNSRALIVVCDETPSSEVWILCVFFSSPRCIIYSLLCALCVTHVWIIDCFSRSRKAIAAAQRVRVVSWTSRSVQCRAAAQEQQSEATRIVFGWVLAARDDDVMSEKCDDDELLLFLQWGKATASRAVMCCRTTARRALIILGELWAHFPVANENMHSKFSYWRKKKRDYKFFPTPHVIVYSCAIRVCCSSPMFFFSSPYQVWKRVRVAYMCRWWIAFVNLILLLCRYRIAAVCGDFYIGGRQFFSLSDLVAYYTSNDLLKREKLNEPIPPPEPVNDSWVS